jgi:hypothetical protein
MSIAPRVQKKSSLPSLQKVMGHTVLGLVLSILIAAPCRSQEGPFVLFREDFMSLQNWRPVSFPNISRHTSYSIESRDGDHYLKAESNASASALLYKGEFDVYEFPKVRWCWKVENVYQRGDPGKKSGDDYPLRVQVVFKYDPEKVGKLKQIEFGLVKKAYGEYPPMRTLSYVWASRESQKTVMTSPFSDTIRIVALEKGSRRCGTWREEEIDIVRDYREAFGVDPPHTAGISIMNDSDDTGERSISYLRFIEVSKSTP